MSDLCLEVKSLMDAHGHTDAAADHDAAAKAATETATSLASVPQRWRDEHPLSKQRKQDEHKNKKAQHRAKQPKQNAPSARVMSAEDRAFSKAADYVKDVLGKSLWGKGTDAHLRQIQKRQQGLSQEYSARATAETA